METENTKAFAKLYKELADYFYNIAPKKEVDEVVRCEDEETGWVNYEPQQVIELDKQGVVSLPIPQIPVRREEFSNKENLFIEELNKNILAESDELNRAVLLSEFGEIGCLITPTREMLIEVGLVAEAALLDDLLGLACFVGQLQSEGVLGYSDIERYREDLKNKTDIAHTNKVQCLHKPKRRGRPTEPITSKMVDDANGCKLQKIHAVMNGKRGKEAALVIWACIKKGWMHKPTYTQVANEFGDIGTQQGFTNYLNNDSKFTQEEKDGAINSLSLE